MSSLLLISGPAGVGKTTICDRLIREFSPSLTRIITVTSRQPRNGEVHGKDYYFISKNEFVDKISSGQFIEHEKVHGNYYGILKSSLECTVPEKSSTTFLLNIDVKGANTIRRVLNDGIYDNVQSLSIFIRPKDLDVLKCRMIQRGDSSNAEIKIRIQTAIEELKSASFFDYVLISNDREHDYYKIRSKYLEFFN